MKELQPITLIMLTLLKATAEFVHSRITSVSCQNAYKVGIEFAISTMNEEYHQQLGMKNLKKELGGLRSRDTMLFPKGWFSTPKEEREYYHLALDHALEIVFNLEARFITGQGDAEPRNYRGKYIHLYNEPDLFKSKEVNNES